MLPLVSFTFLYSWNTFSWGRILAALGRVPLSAPIDPTRVSVSFLPRDGSSPLKLLVRGEPQPVDEVRAKSIIQEEDVEVSIELGMGSEATRYWTCDFSHVSLLGKCTLELSSKTLSSGVCHNQRVISKLEILQNSFISQDS